MKQAFFSLIAFSCICGYADQKNPNPAQEPNVAKKETPLQKKEEQKREKRTQLETMYEEKKSDQKDTLGIGIPSP